MNQSSTSIDGQADACQTSTKLWTASGTALLGFFLLLTCGSVEATPSRSAATAPLVEAASFGGGEDEVGWFGFTEEAVEVPPEPAGEPSIFSHTTGFSLEEAYDPSVAVSVEFENGLVRESAPGALFAFGDWTVLVEGDVEDPDEIMKVVDNGVIVEAADDPAEQFVSIQGSGLGGQSAGYADDWEEFQIAAETVDLSMRVYVDQMGAETPGLWGIALFSASDAEGFVQSFGGLGILGGEVFLSLDGQTIEGESLGAVATGTWVHLALEFDFAARSFDAFVDSQPVATGIAFAPGAVDNLVGFGAFGQGSSLGTTENAYFDDYAILMTGSPVPEPSSLVLVGLGLLWAYWRRKKLWFSSRAGSEVRPVS